MKKLTIILIVLFISTTLKAQSGSMFGKITDNNGQALTGANVLVEGTVLGVSTDSKGSFNLQGIENGTNRRQQV